MTQERFIPRPYRKTPITLRMDIEKLEKIDALALRFNLNRSEFINRCIDFGIQALDKEPL